MELTKINTTNYYIIVLNKSGFTQPIQNWTCPICRMPHIRDWNAAVNILEKGLSKWQNPKIKKAA